MASAGRPNIGVRVVTISLVGMMLGFGLCGVSDRLHGTGMDTVAVGLGLLLFIGSIFGLGVGLLMLLFRG